MKRVLLSLVLLAGLLFGAATVAHAYSPLGAACTTNGSQAAVCQDKNTGTNPLTGPNGLLAKVTRIVAALAGAAALILVVYAGFQYVTSDGDSSKISSAKSAIIGAIVGLIIVAAAQAILTFVVNKVST